MDDNYIGRDNSDFYPPESPCDVCEGGIAACEGCPYYEEGDDE